jgi:UDP-N-acetylmuramate dehydrogenase
MALAVEQDVSLKSLNTFGVEARAAFLVRARSLADLAEIESEPRFADLPRLVLGGGSNVLFTRDFDGLVIKIAIDGVRELGVVDDAWCIEVGAGQSWAETVDRLTAGGRPGLENLARIPGQVGAAPIQNIGAYGLELAERLHSVTVWDPAQRRALTLDANDCGFGYRDSVFKHPGAAHSARVVPIAPIICAVTVALPCRWQAVAGYAEVAQELKQRAIAAPNPGDILAIVGDLRRRKLPDPAQLGNAGSFFKNPVVSREQRTALIDRHPSLVSYSLPGGRYKLAAAWLIEGAGLKGATRGRAGVFERQALVLVNRGGATGIEILQLAREVQDKVAARFGVQLEPEPTII